jgi:hypothetical protein
MSIQVTQFLTTRLYFMSKEVVRHPMHWLTPMRRFYASLSLVQVLLGHMPIVMFVDHWKVLVANLTFKDVLLYLPKWVNHSTRTFSNF